MFHRNGASALTLVIMLTLAGPVLAQQSGKVPTDGNDLLDYCGVVVNLADSPTSPSSTEVRKVLELSGKINWCMGYLQATLDDLSATQINLALIAMAGVTFSGPDEARKYALDSLRFACVPDKATILQVARVLVKWLREHPERLHEPKSILIRDALKEAFPCAAPTPSEGVPASVKP